MNHYQELKQSQGVPIKAWVNGVPFDDGARKQLLQTAQLPIIHKWVAAMPDVHLGLGATIGSVIPTFKAIIPAAVGVDIGCGMMALRTSLTASDLPDHLSGIRAVIENAVPHGRTTGGRDKGSWQDPPQGALNHWATLAQDFKAITDRHPAILKSNHLNHMGTLGTGNHFIEVCLDEVDRVWFMLHSGSRGVGNRIGTYFISLAQKDMRQHIANLPNKDLAYFEEGCEHFNHYTFAVDWAQRFARLNRQTMMTNLIQALRQSNLLPAFTLEKEAVNCHHNYVQKEVHYNAEVWVTRKGAVRAGAGDLGIIPGSMGARSFIVRGKGNPESFHSCSHGAGRTMSRTQAKKKISLQEHIKATHGVACRKDEGVLDESPAAYKSIDAVMNAQKDLVDIVHTLKQVVCVKG